VDRRKLGPIVFADPAQMAALNAIVWPAIRDLAVEEMQKLRKGGVQVCVMEAAVMIEAGWVDIVDEVWVVLVPPDVAKERLMSRNHLSEVMARKPRERGREGLGFRV
jgi:phosphopantetheine adenylyltransferase/dephospho-CoA kinase